MQVSSSNATSVRIDSGRLTFPFLSVCRDSSTFTNSTKATVFYANQSILAWKKFPCWSQEAATHISYWRWPICWTPCSLCCAKNKIKYHSCICTITPEWWCSHGMQPNSFRAAIRFSRVSWTQSFTLSCMDIISCRHSIQNTRITFGGRNTSHKCKS